MKKLLLLFAATLFIACSSDDSEPVNNPDPMDGLSIVEVDRNCDFVNECFISYKITNDSDYLKSFKVRVEFANVDTHYDSNFVEDSQVANPEEVFQIQIEMDGDNEVESVELIDVEIQG